MNDIRAGRSLRIRDVRMGWHLFFVVTDPDPTTKVVTVMLVTERPHTDHTCILDVGDHPFVRHRSSVDYGTARFAPVRKLEEAVRRARASFDADLSDDLLERVRAGLLASGRTPNDVAAHVRAVLGR